MEKTYSKYLWIRKKKKACVLSMAEYFRHSTSLCADAPQRPSVISTHSGVTHFRMADYKES